MASAPKKRSTPKKPAPKKKPAGKKEAAPPAPSVDDLVQRLDTIAALPENQEGVWLVELVIPPGTFIARRVPDPVDQAALNQEIAASAAALRTGNDPDRHRFLITTTDIGGVARQYAKAMCEDIPNPTVPMKPYDRFTIQATLHAQFIGDEEY